VSRSCCCAALTLFLRKHRFAVTIAHHGPCGPVHGHADGASSQYPSWLLQCLWGSERQPMICSAGCRHQSEHACCTVWFTRPVKESIMLHNAPDCGEGARAEADHHSCVALFSIVMDLIHSADGLWSRRMVSTTSDSCSLQIGKCISAQVQGTAGSCHCLIFIRMCHRRISTPGEYPLS
jgi:hypothetical protein